MVQGYQSTSYRKVCKSFRGINPDNFYFLNLISSMLKLYLEKNLGISSHHTFSHLHDRKPELLQLHRPFPVIELVCKTTVFIKTYFFYQRINSVQMYVYNCTVRAHHREWLEINNQIF